MTTRLCSEVFSDSCVSLNSRVCALRVASSGRRYPPIILHVMIHHKHRFKDKYSQLDCKIQEACFILITWFRLHSCFLSYKTVCFQKCFCHLTSMCSVFKSTVSVHSPENRLGVLYMSHTPVNSHVILYCVRVGVDPENTI